MDYVIHVMSPTVIIILGNAILIVRFTYQKRFDATGEYMAQVSTDVCSTSLNFDALLHHLDPVRHHFGHSNLSRSILLTRSDHLSD